MPYFTTKETFYTTQVFINELKALPPGLNLAQTDLEIYRLWVGDSQKRQNKEGEFNQSDNSGDG